MDELKAAMPQAAGQDADTSGLTSEIANLNGKVEELQARLAEYEIIEDDIADLSMFKDENRKLKDEVESLKAKLVEAETKTAEAPAAAAPAEPAPSLTPALDAGIKFEKTDKFELDLNDDAIRAFAAANGTPIGETVPAPETVSPESLGSQAEIDALLKEHAVEEAAPVAAPVVHAAPSAFDDLFGADSAVQMHEEPKAPAPAQSPAAAAAAVVAATEVEDPLAGAPDPDKMLSEVETLSADDGDASDALEEALDTDRLLAEVDSLSKGKAS